MTTKSNKGEKPCVLLRTRVHDEKFKVKILNWFTNGEHFCVEYHHGAIIKGLRIKGTINICLVCHMREGKFDRIHEYVHAHGTFSSSSYSGI